MNPQTIAQALRSPTIEAALAGLVGCAPSGWGKTAQALTQLRGALPIRTLRDYTIEELIDAALILDTDTDRYRWRASGERTLSMEVTRCPTT